MNHRSRDLTRLIARLERLRDQLSVPDPDQAVFFNAAIQCMKVAIKMRIKAGREAVAEEKRKLIAGAYKEGALSIAEIGRAFGVSATVVNKVRKEYGLFKIRSKRSHNQLNMDFK